MVEYILRFHDNRDLYFDVLIKVRDLTNNSYDNVYLYYMKNAKAVVENTLQFEDDGEWELKSMEAMDEIDTVYFG